MIVLAVCRRPV